MNPGYTGLVKVNGFYVRQTALLWADKKYEIEKHEFLQRVRCAPDLRWWKP